MKKKLLSRISFLAMLMISIMVIVAGCGTTTTSPAPATKQAETPAPARPDLILATTTSTQDSGLLDVLVPDFEKKTGYKIKTVAVGTGAALAMGQKGEADVMLVHAPSSEKPLVDNKTAINYQLVMHNDFILVGPSSDPAKVKDTKTAVDAVKAIYASKALFVSRGDDSGTDKMEKSFWKTAKIDPKGSTYLESGQGMGATLTLASEKGAYTLTDRATYLANQKNLKLDILLQGEKSLLNIYHVMQVNPEKFPKVNADGAKAFVDYMVNPDTQKMISEFGKAKYGQALFFADAGKKMEDLGK